MNKSNNEKIEKELIKVFLVLAVLMFTYLFSFSFVFSYQNIIFRYQEVFRVNESVPLNFIGVIIMSTVIIVISFWLSEINAIKFDYIALFIGIIASVIGIVWIYICGSVPGADAGRVSEIASQLNHEDYSSFGAGEYIGMWQQQLGLVSIIRVLYWIFGDMNYNSFRVLSSLSITLLVYSGYKITGLLSKKNHMSEAIYCVLAFFCLPMYFYVPHVYGEMISTALLVFAFWMLMELIEQFNVVKVVLLFIAIFFSVMLRQNTLIAVIAMVGVVLVKCFLSKNKTLLSLAIVIIVSCIIQSQLMNVIYSKHFPTDAKPMPALCWIAMGFNEDNNMAGWWNRESLIIYEESGYNPKAANEKAKDIIIERMSFFVSHPAQMVHFYTKKVSSQWIAPMWQSIAMNNVIDGSESKIAHNIYYNNNISNAISWLMNVYQIIIYGFSLLWLIICFKYPTVLENYLIPITAFGGMLFSIMWEAKTRYMFPYYLMIIVIAAVGIGCFVEALKKKIRRKEK